MDLVVRTPHGDADLTVVSWADAATVSDLVELATGQAAPPLVHIDDRPIDSSTPLNDAPILIGSLVSSHPAPRHKAPTIGAVRLTQLTGRGAGVERELDVGRFRIGPGRRRAATELDGAAVEQPMVELVIETTGVTAAPMVQGAVLLDSQRIDAPSSWSSGQSLRIGSRVFTLDPAASVRAQSGRSESVQVGTERTKRHLAAESDGTIQFSRSPLIAGDDTTGQVADSVRMARTFDTDLWRRRIDPSGIVTLAFGVADEAVVGLPRPVSITLEPRRPGAVTGTAAFRDGMARTLLVEAAARYGPADLAIAIASRSDRLGAWDWTKWLPHLQRNGHLALLTSAAELQRWAGALSDAPGTTLLLLDDAELWSRSDSPIRELVAAPPSNLVMLALADRVERAPAATTSVIAQDSDDMCRLISAGRSMPVVPALVEPDTALDVARALAPLRDAELPPPTDGPPRSTSAPTLAEAMVAAVAGHMETSPLVVALGTSAAGDPAYLDWVPGASWTISGADRDDLTSTAIAIVLSLAVGSSPERTPMVVVGDERSPLAEVVARLPHFAGWCSSFDLETQQRLLSRLANLLDEGGSAVVIVEPFAAATVQSVDDRAGLLVALRTLALGAPGLRILDVMATSSSVLESSVLRSAGANDVTIAVDRRSRALRGIASTADGLTTESFAPFTLRATVTDGPLALRPFVFGRALSPLERRLERASPVARSFDLDESTSGLIDTIIRVHGDLGAATPPRLVPQPLPSEIPLERLLAANEADAVPIGLADDPVHGRHDVVWWQPGADGSMLFIGTPRAGLDVVVSSLTVGIAERFAPRDLVVYAIDASNRRLTALQRMTQTRAGAPLDRLDRVAEIIDVVAREVSDRRAADDAGASGRLDRLDRPSVLLMIGDVTQLGRRLRDSSYAAAIDRLAVAAAGADVGVNVVACASRASDSCGLADLIDTIFVGSLASTSDATALGIDPTLLAALGVGRCRRLSNGELVQLATTKSTEGEIVTADDDDQPDARRAGRR